ncbi:MAG: hypothetical protein KGI60_01190 [Patescibacteria group bacterium]|nr:hypothetical protein [Patescibacteria group bacterium]
MPIVPPLIVTAIDLTMSLFVLVLSLFVMRQNPERKINRIFGVTIFFFASWIICSSLSDITGFQGSIFWALWFARAAIVGPFIFCALFVYFTYFFPKETHELTRWKVFALFLVPVIGVALFPTDYNVASVTLESYGTGFDPGFLYLVLLICLLLYFGFGTYRLIRASRRAKTYHEKAQIFYVVVAAVSFVALGIATNIIFPLYGIDWLSVFGPSLAMFIFGTLTSYAIVKHHLLEVWVVVRMGTIFAIVFAVIGFIYVGGVSLLDQFIGGTASLLLTSFLVVLTFEPLKRFVEKNTDKIFFSQHYRIDDVLDEVTHSTHRLGLDLEKILENFNGLVRRYFKVDRSVTAVLTPRGTFLVTAGTASGEGGFELAVDNPLVEFLTVNQAMVINRDEITEELGEGAVVEKQAERIALLPGAYETLVRYDFTLAIPIALAGKLIAISFIGPKKSNDFYTHQDLQLLDHLAGELGVLINNARLYNDLKKLDEAKSNFISVVSHQLRTPLSAIRWTTELLLGGSVDKNSEEEFLEDTYRNSLFMIYQLDDMLTALDIEDRQIQLKFEQCSVREMIDEVLTDNDSLIKAKKLNIAVSLSPDATTIVADPGKMRKIFEILLRNSIMYAPAEGGTVEAAVRPKSDGDRRLIEISITDNGIGVAPEEQPHMFEKFFRGEEAKKASPNGFGLGLFIVQAFAQAHGGSAHFESAGRGKGARFYVMLPVYGKEK